MRNHKYLTAVLATVAVFMGAMTPAAAAARGTATTSTSSGTGTTSGGQRYHVVRPGDSVTSIANAYGVSADSIRSINGIVGDRLYAGARLLLDSPNPGLTASRISSSSSKGTSSTGTSSKGTGAGGTYTVKDGDVLERIARRHGVKLSALLSANGLKASSLIVEGDVLTIPSGSSKGSGTSGSAGSSSASRYTVKDGDVLERIARRHGVKLSALLSANGLTATNLIFEGDVLTIPTGTASSGTASSGTASSSTAPSSTASSGSESSGGSSAGGSSGSTVGPDLVCPVPGASFMNDWGFPRGSTRFHEGTDLFAGKGTTIYAPASGVVSFGSNNMGGTTFTLSTNSGWVIYGAHLADTIGSSGSVSAGTPIGVVGASGNAAGGDPHLHLGIKPAGGSAINPYPSLHAACG